MIRLWVQWHFVDTKVENNKLRFQPQSKFFPLQLFYNLMHLTFVCLSKFVHGQHLITFFDYYMYKLELTIDYCVPRGWRDNEVPATPLRALADADRPLTWVLFIPTLIWLRVVRFWLSALSIVMGKGEVTAKHMVRKIFKACINLWEMFEILLANESRRLPTLLPKHPALRSPSLLTNRAASQENSLLIFSLLGYGLCCLRVFCHDKATCWTSFKHAKRGTKQGIKWRGEWIRVGYFFFYFLNKSFWLL